MPRECRSCNAPVTFVTGPSGRRMILDARPSDRGNVLVTREADGLHGQVLTPGQLAAARASGVDLWLDHHASCPDADSWRRRARARRRRRGEAGG